jgi:hypothetical protein
MKSDLEYKWEQQDYDRARRGREMRENFWPWMLIAVTLTLFAVAWL